MLCTSGLEGWLWLFLRSSAARPSEYSTDRFRVHSHFKYSRVSLSTQICDLLRHFVLHASFVLAQEDSPGSRLFVIFATKRKTLRCSSSVQPVADILSFVARMGPATAPRKILPDIEDALGFREIHCIMFSGRTFAFAPLSTATGHDSFLGAVISDFVPRSRPCRLPGVIVGSYTVCLA